MLKRTITAIALAGAMTLGAQSAQAVVLDGWNLNLSVANGQNVGGFIYNGLTDITNVNQFSIGGQSTVVQQFQGGSPAGQSFTDDGFLQFNQYTQEGNAFNFDVSASLGNATTLFLEFTGLTGTFNADGTITFDAGVGSIGLYLENDANNDSSDGNALLLASYDIVDPSGGSDVDFFGGANPTGTIDVTLEQTAGFAGLFTDQNGNDLDLPFVFQLVNVNAQQPTGGPDFFLDPVTGDGFAIVDPISNDGQFNISIVPEPGTLGIFGVGLLGLGIAAARRRRREAAAA